MDEASRYSWVREIGRGGMGAVWLARDLVLGRDVALKRLGGLPGVHSSATPDVQRAAREARLAAALNHPHVVAVYDLVEDGESQLLVMEYVEGRSLADLVRHDGPLSPDDAAAILAQVADALAAAHAAGIVHRDVKPSNILVTEDGTAKLSDFGIARAENDAALTQTGLVTGSPAYLSPEVVSGRTARIPADVWSLGATAFHTVQGRPPYDVGEDLMDAMYRIVHEAPPEADRADWLRPLLHRTMATDPRDRWTMAQVREFLTSHGARIGTWRAAGTSTGDELPAMAAAAPAGDPSTLAASAEAPPHGPGDAVRYQDGDAADSPDREDSLLPGGDEPDRRSGRRGLLVGGLAMTAVVILGLVGWLLWVSQDQDPTASTSAGSSASGAPSTTEPTDPTTEPSDPPTDSPSDEPLPEPTAKQLRTFLREYVRTAMTDPQSAFGRLTPGFQESSGGYSEWTGWWGGFQSAEVTHVIPDVEGLSATYTVHYVERSGTERTETSTVSFIQEKDGSLKIAAEQS